MAPSYKLRYFDMPGAAEPIRLLFSYGKIPFVDERIPRKNWSKIKPTTPLSQVPVLEIDGKPIPQTFAICRYVGALVNLAGNDAMENLLIDIAAETLADLITIVRQTRIEQDEKKMIEIKKKLSEALLMNLGKLNEFAKNNGGYIALKRLSWVDVFFLNFYELIMNMVGTDTFNAYPSLQRVKNNVLAQPTIRDWIMKRPDVTGGPITYTFQLKQDL